MHAAGCSYQLMSPSDDQHGPTMQSLHDAAEGLCQCFCRDVGVQIDWALHPHRTISQAVQVHVARHCVTYVQLSSG
jgi:hypothetical protein